MKEHIKENRDKKANVIRDGQTVIILRREIVCGDIVEIKAGDEIPADLRIIQADGIKVNNSYLTGESEYQALDGDVADSGTPLLEAKNMAFAMTSCVEGSARGIVVRCGQDTISGKVMHLQTEFAIPI